MRKKELEYRVKVMTKGKWQVAMARSSTMYLGIYGLLGMLLCALLVYPFRLQMASVIRARLMGYNKVSC